MKLKRLNLDNWMKFFSHERILEEGYIELKGALILNRDGRYYNRLGKIEWFEKSGKVYIKSCEMHCQSSFEYELSLLNHSFLSAQQVKELKHIVTTLPKANKKIKQELSNLLYIDYNAKNIRNLYRSNRKHFMATRMKLLAIKANK